MYAGFDLFDYRAVDLETAKGSFCLPEGIFPGDLVASGVCTCEGCASGDIGRHNRLALERELALIRRFIVESRLRDLVEMRCRSDPHQVAILRLLDGEEAFLEPYHSHRPVEPFHRHHLRISREDRGHPLGKAGRGAIAFPDP